MSPPVWRSNQCITTALRNGRGGGEQPAITDTSETGGNNKGCGEDRVGGGVLNKKVMFAGGEKSTMGGEEIMRWRDSTLSQRREKSKLENK